MKKILNKVDDLVLEMCEGMVRAHPTQLAFNKKFKVLSRVQVNKEKVSLISGGGSGHEPAHGGFVGAGMLDAERIHLPRNLPYVQKSVSWVHVAQRFPVRIQLQEPPEALMRLGASAAVEVGYGSACR